MTIAATSAIVMTIITVTTSIATAVGKGVVTTTDAEPKPR